MAVKMVRSLICDKCGSISPTDDLSEAGGILLRRWSWANEHAGNGSAKDLYLCLKCCSETYLSAVFGLDWDRH